MDARDSSSPPSTAAEDGGATATLAKEAASNFQSGKYAECVEVLNQLLQKNKDDPKVLHNIAIAEYFRDGCSDPKKLLQLLNAVKEKSEELAQTSREQGEADSNVGNKVVLGSTGNNPMTLLNSSANSASIVYVDGADTAISTLNIAVMWFYLHEYEKASSVLEPLYQNIEPIDETTAFHICFLLLEAGLTRQAASKSADVLLYLEKAIGASSTGQGDYVSAAHQQSGYQVSKSSSVPSNSSAQDSSNSDSGPSMNVSENTLSRTLSEDTLEYESMLSSLNLTGRNLSWPASLSSLNDSTSQSTVDSYIISTIDLKLKLQFYKVKFLLLTRNLKHAKREVKHVMNIARGKDSSLALLLKAQLEYARGNHHKSIKLLMASTNRTEMELSSIFHNNLGCIYYQLGNYHTATVFFSKALSNSSSIQKDKIQKDNSLLILYNCGVQYLSLGKPLIAAQCFQKSSLILSKRPLLWLRIAECCLMDFKSGHPKTNSDVRVHVVGKGKWRHLVLEDRISRRGNVNSTVGSNDWYLGSNEPPKLSLSLAKHCLCNALYLLNRSESSSLHSKSSLEERDSGEAAASSKSLHDSDSKPPLVNANGDSKEQKGNTIQELVRSSLSHYKDIYRRENLLIKQALLANHAYVELELENPSKALTFARSLLELPECSRVYIFLGHVYAAEALCLLNRPNEAAEHLLNYLSGESNQFGFPFSQEECEQWHIDRTADSEDSSFSKGSQGIVFLNPEEALGIIYANFAAISAIQGNLEQASQFVAEALTKIPNRPEAILTSVSLDLMLGKSQEALLKLKRCSCVRFLPSGLKLNKNSS